MKTILMSLIIICILTSCSKTDVSGYVYSKNGLPVINGRVILKQTHNGRGTGNDKTVAVTDNNGFYYFKFKWKYNKGYRVRCESDSGLALGVEIRDEKNNIIILDSYYQ
jgi:hypothetical protein